MSAKRKSNREVVGGRRKYSELPQAKNGMEFVEPKDTQETILTTPVELGIGPPRESPTLSGNIFNRKEARARLRLKPSHFSKVTNGKVRGLPKLACLRVGRLQFFREETLARWINEVEALSCNGVH